MRLAYCLYDIRFKKYFRGTRLPCLIVGTKADRREVVQSYEMQPDEFCRRYRLSPPVKFGAFEQSTNPGLASGDCAVTTDDVYLKLAMLANFP